MHPLCVCVGVCAYMQALEKGALFPQDGALWHLTGSQKASPKLLSQPHSAEAAGTVATISSFLR